MDEATTEFLRSRGSGGKPAPVKHQVAYGDLAVVFEERYVGPRLILIASCPKCGDPANVDSTEYQIAVDRSTGKLSLHPSLVCPRVGCGLHVTVKDGVMEDSKDS